MELRIRPDDLYAASVALSSCATTLDAAAIGFARTAQLDVPDVGFKASAAVGRGVVEAERALDIVARDIERLAQALASLARVYPRLDRTAVRRG
jgi:hypothetical protein